jgi:uncharacterized membrane protein YgaE (UPF0421/DUF939 family)
MSSLPSISDALKGLTKRNELHEKIMIIFAASLFIIGLAVMISAIFLSNEVYGKVIGGGIGFIIEVLIIIPFNKIQDIRKQNLLMGMLAAIIDRFQDKLDSATLNELIKELLEHSLGRSK